MTELAYSPPAALDESTYLSLEAVDADQKIRPLLRPCVPCLLDFIESRGAASRIADAEYVSLCRYSDGTFGTTALCVDCAREIERRLAATRAEGSTR